MREPCLAMCFCLHYWCTRVQSKHTMAPVHLHQYTDGSHNQAECARTHAHKYTKRDVETQVLQEAKRSKPESDDSM